MPTTSCFGADFATGAVAPDEILDFGLGADRLLLAEDFAGQVTVSDTGDGVLLALGAAGAIHVAGPAAELLKGTDLGGGTFALTTDESLVDFLTARLRGAGAWAGARGVIRRRAGTMTAT